MLADAEVRMLSNGVESLTDRQFLRGAERYGLDFEYGDLLVRRA